MQVSPLLLPNRLNPGDRIGIVSPSSPVTQEIEAQFEKGVAFLEAHGFRVVFGKHIRSNTWGYTSSAQERADDINAMFADDSTRAIICSQGGVTANACLPYLDYDLIRHNPKILLGISDISILLNAIHHKTGLVTFHGNDVIWGFGRRPTAYDEQEFSACLMNGRVGGIPSNGVRRCVRSGSASGKLLGGNLASFMKLAGTPYLPDVTGAILVLEALEIKPEACDYYFQQMKQMGIFDRISAAVIGYVYSMEKATPDQMQMEDVFLRVTEEYTFPILKVRDFGHNCSNTVLPIGAQARINAEELTLEIAEKYIE